MTHVVILGGGFGGLAAAHELRTNHSDVEVTLLDRKDHFFMGFAKLWDLGHVRPLSDGTRSLAKLADRGVRFRQAEITALDPSARIVETSEGTLEADAILVALGAAKSPRHLGFLNNPGAHDLYDGAQLPAMHADLDALTEGRILISILGGPFQCPPAPYEAALLVDERLRQRGVRDKVELAVSTPQPMTLPVAGADASQYLAGYLGDRDIDLLSEKKVTEVDGGTRTVTFADGSTCDYSVFLGVPACVASPLLTETGLTGESGFIEPDRHTLRTDLERVYAVGDSTHIPTATGALPKAGVFAAGEAVVAARNIAADLVGSAEASFDGHGFCFLELPGRRVALVEGDFFAEPRPDVELTEADEDQFLQKQAYETERLDTWLG